MLALGIAPTGTPTVLLCHSAKLERAPYVRSAAAVESRAKTDETSFGRLGGSSLGEGCVAVSKPTLAYNTRGKTIGMHLVNRPGLYALRRRPFACENVQSRLEVVESASGLHQSSQGFFFALSNHDIPTKGSRVYSVSSHEV